MNLNDHVLVKLTAAGARVAALAGEDHRRERWSLWRLMQVFGPEANMGQLAPYFERNEVTLEVDAAEPAPSLVEQTARLEVISSHRDTLQEAWESAASQAVTPAERAVLDATGFFDELNLCALERSGHEVFAAAVRSLRAAREAGGR